MNILTSPTSIPPSSPDIIQIAEALARLVAGAMVLGDAPPVTDKLIGPPPALTATNGEALLTTREAATMLCLSARTLEGFRLKGGGPPFKVLGRHTVRYQADELRAWVASRTAPHSAKARQIIRST